MPMLLEKTFSSTAEFLSALSSLSVQIGDEAVWFRGHSRASYKLLPSLARNPRALEREALLSKRFKQNAYPFRQNPPQSEWEWLFLMQHFGIPTRLLDWTESPLVSLYFTVNDSDPSHDSEDGEIWALLPAKYNFEIPRLRPLVSVDIPCFGVDPILDDYRPDRIILETMSNKLPVAAIAHRQNERIMAQLGVFTIMHRDMTPLEEIAPQFLARLKIPAQAKPQLRAELKALRVTQMTLFPELTSVAMITKELLK
jgi:FRG domain